MKLETTRQAIHDALAWAYMQKSEGGIIEYLLYLCRIEKSARNHEPNVDFLEAGYICAAVDALRPELGGWAKFCYGPDEKKSKDWNPSTDNVIQNSLAGRLRMDLFDTSTPRKHNRLIGLCWSALEDYRLGVVVNKTLPIVEYARKMETNPDQFERDWGDKKRLVIKRIREWDAEAVARMSSMVRALKGHSEIRPAQVLADMLEERKHEKKTEAAA